MAKKMTSALAGLFLFAGFAAPSLGAERVIFMTDWKPEAEQGGFYEAAAMGFYAKHGLDVQIRSGGSGANPQQLMAAGAVDMAIGSNSFFALNLVKAGAPVVAVMASYQKDPEVLILHPEDPATGIADLKGRAIMISDASIDTMWAWLKGKYGFDDKQIRKYTGNPAPFIVDKKAIQQGYVTSEPLVVEQKGGFKPKLFLLADSGYSTYGAMVLVKSDWVVEQAGCRSGFRRCLDRGLERLPERRSGPGRRADQKGQSRHDRRHSEGCPRADEGIWHRRIGRHQDDGDRCDDRRALGRLLQDGVGAGALSRRSGLQEGVYAALHR